METLQSSLYERPCSAHPTNNIAAVAQRSLGTTLVTGANGFVGSNLIAELARRSVPTIAAMRSGRVVNPEIFDANPFNVQTRELPTQVDCLRHALDGVDTVVHVAGRVVASDLRTFLQTNYSLTRRLVEAASQMRRPPHIVLISSVSASGPRTGRYPRTASDPARPISLYGRSKLAGERIARRYADRVPVTILRPGIVFGPGDREVLQLIRVIEKSHVNLLAGYARPKFPFVAVQDLAAAVIAAAEQGATIDRTDAASGRGVYFVADPEMQTFARFGALVSRALGQRLYLNVPLPMFFVQVAARLSERLADPAKPSTFNPDKIREANVRGWECDVSKTMQELAWRPQPIEQRIEETIDWYRRAGWLGRS